MVTVVFVSSVLVNTVENSLSASTQTNAILSSSPRSPRKPMSTTGDPVCVQANAITGSSITVLVVSIVVVVPLIVKLPDTVKSLP